jgi:gliding motility-associated-like protein/uncharacterized repeat protein (TIGR01451 family)
MNYVDIDGLSSTFMSSSDSLNLANCSEILWAGLYWSGRATSAVSNWNIRNQVKIRVGNSAYQSLSADQLVDAQSLGTHPSYHCFKNITSFVQSAGIKARFSVANVVTQTGGSNYWGGWSIIVVYKNVFQSMRNLTVFDGFGNISSGSSLDIPISGFATPPSGPVGFELGVVGFEGDRGSTGDQLQFNGAGTFVNVSDALHPTNDFFNSTISYGGAVTSFRNPNLNNSLGYDASVFLPNNTTFNYIGNNATSATLRVTTSSENILARAFTSAIDIYEPDLRADVRINDLNGGLVTPGDILEYTLVGKNIGSDLSLNTFLVDTLDPRTVYVPNSISYNFGSNSGSKTDLIGDDQADYNATNKTLKFRIGNGANGLSGGQVLASSTGADSTVVKFRVQVINDCLMFQCDSTLSHVAYIYGTGNISGNSYNNGGASDTYDSNGCPSVASNVLLIDVSGCPDPTIISNSPICIGENIVLSASFSAAATYSWTGPSLFTGTGATQTINNPTLFQAGTYQVVITFSGLTCSLVEYADALININPVLGLDSLHNSTCFNLSNGEIFVSASSGSPSYQYQWTPGGSTNSSLTNLSPGTYTVIVTDANTCKDTAVYTITQPTAILATASKTSNYNGRDISCFGSANGSATVVYSGGTPPYQVSWSPGGATTSSISNLGPGTYTATITDANGCVKTSSVTLTQPAALTSSHTQVNVSCFGGANGSINLTNGGGTPGYTYSWSNGATTQDISGLSAGTYSVIITDLNGCTKSHSVTITQPAAPLSLTSSQVNVLCYGNATGSIDVTPSGGTPNYTYSWSNGSLTQDISNLAAGTYVLTTTDSKNCTTTLTVTISQPAAPLSSSVVETNIACFGNSTGGVNLTVNGGTTPYNFSWSNSALSEDLNGLLPGQYIVTITDNNGCILKDTANLTQPLAPLSITLSKDDVDCFGALDGSIDATVSGGTTPYGFSWNNGSITEDIQNLGAGNYMLQVTDHNGCQLSANTTIMQPSAIITTSTEVDVLCYGEATGSINVSVLGGISPYQFSWNTGSTNEDISNLIAGSYTITVTDNNACTGVYSTSILQPAQPLTLSITHTDALCLGGQQGTTNLTATGGTAPYTYLWNNNQTAEDLTNLVSGYYYCMVTDNHGCIDTIGATILDPSNTMLPSITHTDVSCFAGSDGTVDLTVTGGLSPYGYSWNTGAVTEDLNSLPTGNYFVTITDGNSCQSFISTFVDQPQSPLITTEQITNVLCFNAATGAIDITTSGGTQPYSFSWSGGQTTEDLVGLTAGTYQLTITDAKNCLLVVNPQITQPADIQLSAITQNINCFGQSTGWIDLSVVGGVSPYTYSWISGQNTQDLNTLPAGTYQVLVTDVNQCQDSLTITLTQPALPLQVTAVTTNILCNGGNNGSIDVTISGGTTPYAFNWSNANLTQDQQDLYAGTYQINITDNKGCTTLGNYTLTEPLQALSTQITMTEPLCYGNSNGTATVTASGGTAPYSYLWQGGLQTTPSITGIPIGMYIVEVTDANNCKIKDTIIVTQPTPLIVNADSTWVSCLGLSDGGVQSIVQGGVGPYSYNWSPINSATPNVGNLPAGVYTITVTDFFNCQAQSSTEILQPDSLYATFVNTNILCNGFATGAIDASVFGGTQPYSYFCPTLLPSADLSNLAAGTYNYSVVDDNGCTKQYSIQLTQPVAVSTTAQMIPVNCFAGSDGALNITTSGGVGPYAYLWSNGQTTQDIDSLTAGSYSVQVTDANNCVNTFNFAVTQPQQPLTLSLTQVNVACFGASTGSINLSVSGGTPIYSYTWNSGQGTQDVFALDTGFYQVIVTDINDCVDSISTIITQPAAPISITETHVDILCFGASTGSIDITPSGGTPSVLNGYIYDWSNNQTTEDIQTIPAGTYEVVVSDSLQCTDTLEVTLTQPQAPLDVTFTIENVKCFGDSTGSLLANITGGTAPYEFGWSTLDSTLFIDSLPLGNYVISVIDSNNCTYSETALVTQPSAPLSATYVEVQPQCFGYSDGQLILTTTGGTPGYQYDWTTGDSTSVVDSLATGTYSVLVTDANGCTFNLDCFLGEPAQIQPSFDSDILSGCSPLVVEFFNTSDADFNCEWTFGDSLTYEGCDDVVITFETGGIYDVNLTAYDANGCFNDVTYNDYITVYQTPTASISADPTQLFPESPVTNILNTSTTADFYIWNMGVGDPDEMYFEPGAYQYPIGISDTFLITLYAITTEGCADTAYQQIFFNNDPFYYVPNTFIPNDDNRNDIWTPIFSNLGNVKKYNVQVYDRWGELIFESKDPTFGWNGTYNGQKCQDGTYLWKVQFTWYDKRVYDATGHVNLLR